MPKTWVLIAKFAHYVQTLEGRFHGSRMLEIRSDNSVCSPSGATNLVQMKYESMRDCVVALTSVPH